MATIKRFEDIQAWQKARVLVPETYQMTTDASWTKDVVLKDQSRRAALSIVSNSAEGFARRTSTEFINFLAVAHGSAAELQAQLSGALDLDDVGKERFQSLYNLTEEVSKMVHGLSASLRASSPRATLHSPRSTLNS